MSKWTDVPLEVREMLSRTPNMTSRVSQTWQMLLHRGSLDPGREIKHKAADMVAHEFAGEVLRHGQWRVEENPQEIVYRVDAYCLTYDRLLALVMEAYGAGRREGIRRQFAPISVELSQAAPITDSLAR